MVSRFIKGEKNEASKRGELSKYQVKRIICCRLHRGTRTVKIYFKYTAWVIEDLVSTPIAIILLLTPIFLFLPPEQWNNPEAIQNFFWRLVLWDLISMSLWSIGNAVRREQRLGTLEQLFLTNANRAILFTRSMISRLISFF